MSDQPREYIAYVDSDLEELIPDFFANRHKDVQKIVKALETNDFEAIKAVGHTLKGIGGGYGFDDITEIGREVEKCAKEENADYILYWANELYRYLTDVQIYYQ